jgi:hypothetical protein
MGVTDYNEALIEELTCDFEEGDYDCDCRLRSIIVMQSNAKAI